MNNVGSESEEGRTRSDSIKARESCVIDEVSLKQRQHHLNTIAILNQISRGERVDKSQVEADLLEDPLDAHLLYARWILDTYSSNEQILKDNLVPVLEQSTRTFVEDQRYRPDLRYLKLWALYARQCSQPGAIQIYEFLESKGIGVTHSMFFEEWANAVESVHKDLSKVSRIFDLGINLEAKPLNRLKKKKNAVVKRMSDLALTKPDEVKNLCLKPHLCSPQTDFRRNVTSQTFTTNAKELSNDPLRNHFAHSATKTEIVKQITGESSVPQPSVIDGASKKAEPGAPPRAQRFAFDISLFYPVDGTEVTTEERQAVARYGSKVWGTEPWELEAFTSGKWYSYQPDGSPILYHPVTGEPLFDYLKAPSSPSSDMHLSDDESALLNPIIRQKNIASIDADQSAQMFEDPISLASIDPSFSSANLSDYSQVGQEAIADTEISINLDSPVRDSNATYVKPLNRRASVTVNTQEALNDVYDMFGKPADAYDCTDDENSDVSDACEPTGYTAIGVRDATADITFWAQPTSSTSNESGPVRNEPVVIYDENCLDKGRHIGGFLEISKTSPNSSAQNIPLSNNHRVGTFKPTRKPLAPLKPFSDENALCNPAPSSSKILQSSQSSSSLKRIPLAVKESYCSKSQDFSSTCDGLLLQNPAHPPVQYSHQASSEIEDPDDCYNTPILNKRSQGFFNENEEVINTEMDETDELCEYEQYGEDEQVDRRGRVIHRPLRFIPFGENFEALTPITEKTSECYSSMTSRYFDRVKNQVYETDADSKLIEKFANLGSEDEDEEMTPKPNELRISGSLGHIQTVHEDKFIEPTGASVAIGKASDFCFRQSLEAENNPVNLSCINQSLKSDSSYLYESNSRGDFHGSPLRAVNIPSVPPTPTTIQADEPCNPFSEDIINILLKGLDPPLEEYPGFRALGDVRSSKLDELKKRCKPRNPRKSSNSAVLAEEVFLELNLDGDVYFINDKLGEGAYGSVFKVSEPMKENQKAMKVENPPNLYEFFILSQLHNSLSERLCESLILPHKLYAYSDESFLVMDYSDQGTLLDVVNRASEVGVRPISSSNMKGVDELLAIFFTVELMRVVEGLHEAGYIHGDLKIDNCLVRLEGVPGGVKSWSSVYEPEGNDGWRFKGLKLIDYGRSIDINVFPPGQEFVVDWETDEYDCLEMRTGQPWTFQPDYHGIVSIAYCLLFGSFMTATDSKKPLFKRYHQVELWNRLFDVCLRPRQIPNTQDLKETRLEMENWLKENCERNGKSLKGLLRKIEFSFLH
ncbi:BUB protein kinase [Phakopsora pachyrhizi]|uniref:BUB protein kinase n=1 Tax=Phakopsora pachyrhizi TaxID=170000 RepID=A0AAV0BQA4_PHAPC|nr:BUB protein kinase [Phakopsora pachyrhizi]